MRNKNGTIPQRIFGIQTYREHAGLEVTFFGTNEFALRNREQ